MKIELLTKEEREYAEQLGKAIFEGKIRGRIYLIDELEKKRIK